MLPDNIEHRTGKRILILGFLILLCFGYIGVLIFFSLVGILIGLLFIKAWKELK